MSAAYITSHQLRRQLPLLERFQVRETRAKKVASTQERPINPHAFQPFKSPDTGRWYPPRISLRRQAQLGKEAYKAGKFDDLVRICGEDGIVQSVKLNKMKMRIEELSGVGTAPTEAASISAPSTTKISKQHAENRARRLAKALAATRGPYTGRSEKVLFKGTKAERSAPGRKRETAQKLSMMDQSVETWRKVSFILCDGTTLQY